MPGYYTDQVKAYICLANITTPIHGLLGDGYARSCIQGLSVASGRTPADNAAPVSQLATHPGGRWYVRRYVIRLLLPPETNSKIIPLLPSKRALPCFLDADRTSQRPATISYVPRSAQDSVTAVRFQFQGGRRTGRSLTGDFYLRAPIGSGKVSLGPG